MAQVKTDIPAGFESIETVFGPEASRLTEALRDFERDLPALPSGPEAVAEYLSSHHINAAALDAALELKKAASQVDVMIHATGILLALSAMLQPDETVESLSLGAGNTGKDFDLITDKRLGEFKFIRWRGGSEAQRQTAVFIDFLKLLWDDRPRTKQVFVVGTARPLAFFRSKRSIASVLSRRPAEKTEFDARYGDRYETVGQFYREHESDVELVDLTPLIPALGTSSAIEVLED